MSIKETQAIHSMLRQLTNGTTAGKCVSILFSSFFYNFVLGIAGRAGKSGYSYLPPLFLRFVKVKKCIICFAVAGN